MTETSQNEAGRGGIPLRKAVWAAAGLLLLLPYVAMKVTGQVAWDLADFVMFGVLLLIACSAFELLARLSRNPAYRAGAAVALGASFLLVWVNLAVGFIGAEGNPANLMFAGVLATVVVGAAAARLRPLGMARALLAAAIAQVLVAVIALAARFGSAGPGWPFDILKGTVFFTALWLLSAWLFRKAAREQAP